MLGSNTKLMNLFSFLKQKIEDGMIYFGFEEFKTEMKEIMNIKSKKKLG